MNPSSENLDQDDFIQECERAIIDRDEKISDLLYELNLQKTSNSANGKEQLSFIKNSLQKTNLGFRKLQKWIENFENRKLCKLSSINSKLFQENQQLTAEKLFLLQQQKQNNKRVGGFICNLKTKINIMRNEMSELKNKHEICNHELRQFFCQYKDNLKNKDNMKFCSPDSTKYISTMESDNNKSYESRRFMTPHKTTNFDERQLQEILEQNKNNKRNASTNTPFNQIVDQPQERYDRNMFLRDEYKRKSIIIQCILKSLNKKNLEKMKQSWIFKDKMKNPELEDLKKKIKNNNEIIEKNEKIEKIDKETDTSSYFLSSAYTHKEGFSQRRDSFNFQNENKREIVVKNNKTIESLYNKCMFQKNIFSL